jgi:RNA polymerase sigma-70 factor (ECF subfamily)
MFANRFSRLADDALLAAVAAGQHRAFTEFYDRHLPGVLAYFRARVESADVAFDLAAETFASVLASASRFDPGKGSALGWVYAIARNLLVDSYRRRAVSDETRRRLRMQPVELCDDDTARVDSLAAIGAAQLAAALNSLPTDQRDAIIARVVLEHSYAEIAATLTCSQSVVRQRVSRGLRNIRCRLENDS